MAKKTTLKILIFVFIIFSCAKQQAPSGGPKDSEPPRIIETYPLNGTVNFKENKIEVEFSEYLDKQSVRNSIFISPDIDNYKLSWSGKKLDIIIKDSLKKNTTYTITFGSGIRDLNEKNEMGKAYSLMFSTGDKIDKGIISGYVFDKNPNGVIIFAYKQITDTVINFLSQEPDYTTQCSSDGNFSLGGLSSSEYYLFVFRDINSNKLFDENEPVGIQSEKIFLATDSAKFYGVNFKLTRFDTVKPQLEEITMTDRNHILLEFSEPIDSSRLSPNNFFIIDSTTLSIFKIEYVFNGNVKRNKFMISLETLPKKGNNLYLSIDSVYDKNGNPVLFTTKKIYFNEKPDTMKPKLIKYESLIGNGKLDFRKPSIRLLFNDGVNFSNEKVVFTDSEQKIIPISIQRINDAEFILTVEKILKSNSDYFLSIDLNKITDAAGNKGDSTITYKFLTLDKIDFVWIKGKIEKTNNAENDIYVILESLKNNLNFKTKVGLKGKFVFKSVLPGEYFIFSFIDRNANGKFDYGSLSPYNFSEKFTFRTDTIVVKPRWPIKDLNLKFIN